MKIKWLLFGNISYVILQWLVVSFLSKKFGTESLGDYFFALSVSAPLFLLLSLKLPTLAITYEQVEGDKKTLTFTRLVASVTALVVSSVASEVFFSDRSNLLMVIAVGLFKFFEQFDDLEVAYFLKNKSYKRVSVIKFQRGAAYLICIVFVGLINNNATNAIFIGTVVYSLIWIFRNYRSLNFNGAIYSKVIGCFKIGLSLGTSAAVSSLSTNFSRVYVGVVLGGDALGIFGSIGYASTVFSLFVSALGQYYVSQFVDCRNNKQSFLLKILESQLISFVFGLFLLMVSFIWGAEFLRLAYNDEVARYAIGLTIILGATIFKASSALIGTSIVSTQKYYFQFGFSILSTLIVVITLPFFLEAHHMLGAFYAILIVNMVEWVVYVIFGCKYYVSYFSKLDKSSG